MFGLDHSKAKPAVKWEDMVQCAIAIGAKLTDLYISKNPKLLDSVISDAENYHWIFSNRRREDQLRFALQSNFEKIGIPVTRNEFNILVSVAGDAAYNRLNQAKNEIAEQEMVLMF